jgi:hypothetical protein
MRKLALFTWQYFIVYPEFLSLLATENLNRAAYLKKSTRIRHLHAPLVEQPQAHFFSKNPSPSVSRRETPRSVNRDSFAMSASLPAYPRERTLVYGTGMPSSQSHATSPPPS